MAVRPVPSIPWVTSSAVEEAENPDGPFQLKIHIFCFAKNKQTKLTITNSLSFCLVYTTDIVMAVTQKKEDIVMAGVIQISGFKYYYYAIIGKLLNGFANFGSWYIIILNLGLK